MNCSFRTSCSNKWAQVLFPQISNSLFFFCLDTDQHTDDGIMIWVIGVTRELFDKFEEVLDELVVHENCIFHTQTTQRLSQPQCSRTPPLLSSSLSCVFPKEWELFFSEEKDASVAPRTSKNFREEENTRLRGCYYSFFWWTHQDLQSSTSESSPSHIADPSKSDEGQCQHFLGHLSSEPVLIPAAEGTSPPRSSQWRYSHSADRQRGEMTLSGGGNPIHLPATDCRWSVFARSPHDRERVSRREACTSNAICRNRNGGSPLLVGGRSVWDLEIPGR